MGAAKKIPKRWESSEYLYNSGMRGVYVAINQNTMQMVSREKVLFVALRVLLRKTIILRKRSIASAMIKIMISNEELCN